MYPFRRTHKQNTHTNIDFLVLASEPIETEMIVKRYLPHYQNMYLSRRRVRRTIRRLRQV